jgi:Helix-turn-helix domain
MSFFNLDKEEKNKIIAELKESYSLWREKNKKMNKPFFMIHNDFEHLFLKDISGGALKLYIYLGFRSKYQTGESWESVETVSSFFGKDPRTISKWFAELEDIGLITRKQKGFKMKATTFLRPYGFFFNGHIGFPNTTIDDVESDILERTKKGLEPYFALMLNYGFREYTLVLLYRDKTEPIYFGTYFIDFDQTEGAFNNLKSIFKKRNIKIDSYDIDASLLRSSNPEMAIYNYLLQYLREENLS